MGSHSLCEINENGGLLNGMRIKLACASSACSLAAPSYLVISGLDESKLVMNDKELKKSNGMLAFKINGFSMRSNTDPLNQSLGHVIFQRSSKNEYYSADKARYNFYNKEACCPFVSGIRKLKNPK